MGFLLYYCRKSHSVNLHKLFLDFLICPDFPILWKTTNYYIESQIFCISLILKSWSFKTAMIVEQSKNLNAVILKAIIMLQIYVFNILFCYNPLLAFYICLVMYLFVLQTWHFHVLSHLGALINEVTLSNLLCDFTLLWLTLRDTAMSHVSERKAHVCQSFNV